MNSLKNRLDVTLVSKGLFETREKAKASIMAGVIFVDGQRIDKAGTLVKESSDFYVKENLCPYVSRGGLKLEKALKFFDISLKDSITMDMGASTGGFTDCMLKEGAKKVYSIDVGYGQLDYKLRIDERVVNMERTNIRYLDTSLITDPIDFISIDVSFISLGLILPVASKVLSDHGSVVCLVKPQFEAGKSQVGKKGIVRDPKVHKEVLKKVIDLAKMEGLFVQNLTFSPVTGTKGNIEYLLYISKKFDIIELENLIDTTVELAHENLKKD